MNERFERATRDIGQRLTGLARRLIAGETVICEGSVIPARHLRFGGQCFARDLDFLRSGEREADRLVKELGLRAESRLLEVGCGPGRLPIGILRRGGELRGYCGVDVNAAAVGWCQRHIESAHPAFQFFHLDLQNARYNPAGATIGEGFRLPFESRSFDVIYLYSVFSHMGEKDVERYLAEFRRLLAPGGRVFLTLFVEEDVPPVTVNPPDYRREWRGALHCVRYQRGHFEGLLARHGLQLVALDPGTETDGQSAVTLA